MSSLHAHLGPGWPASDAATSSPVLILLHGFGSHEHDLASLAPVLPPEMPWASVRAPMEMGYGAAAWFPLDPSFRIDESAVESATSALWEWIDSHVPSEAPVVPFGFSQGGFMALRLLRSRPARVPGAIVLSGFVGTATQPGDDILAAAPPPVLWARGDADPVIPRSAIEDLDRWLAGHTRARVEVRPGLGHGIDDVVMAAVRDFVQHSL